MLSKKRINEKTKRFLEEIKNPAYLSNLGRAVLAFMALALLLPAYRLAALAATGDLPAFFGRTWFNIKALVLTLQAQEAEAFLILTLIFFMLVNGMRRSIRKPVYLTSAAFLSLWLQYRGLNLIHVYYTGAHLDKTTILHADISFLKMLLDIRVPLLLLGAAAATALVLRLMRGLDLSNESPPRRLTAFFVLVALGAFMFFALEQKLDPASMALKVFSRTNASAAISPEQVLVSSFTHDGYDKAEISPELARRMESLFGITLNPAAPLPLYRSKTYETPLPFPLKKGATSTPNIIIFMLESLSAKLMGHYGNPHPGITPNLDSFARAATDIGPTYNASMPTTYGVISTLCSTLPVIGLDDWADYNFNVLSDLLCLPEILKARGYHTYDIDPSNPYLGNRRAVLQSNGIDEFYDYRIISASLKEKTLSPISSSVTDHQLFRYIKGALESGKFKEPFIMSVVTIDMHPPYRVPPDAGKYAGNKDPVLTILHSTDEAFGIFWGWFKNSRLAENTIVILTADHSIYSPLQFRKVLFGQEAPKNNFDTIPFLLLDPTHALPGSIDVTTSAVDIAPSLLHLLGINVKNPFEGLSVFDPKGRPSYPNLLGSTEHRFFYLLDGKENFFIRVGLDCPSKEQGPFTECDYLAWHKYKRWITFNDLIWSPGAVPEHLDTSSRQ